MTGTTLIISPAPTANGDLHLGHIAGPFLAADVHTRYLRASGRDALLVTGFQDTSSYVVTTAHRMGVEPERLVELSALQIRSTLAAVGIEIDGYTGDEDRFVKTVLGYMESLYASGAFELREMRFPYLSRTGEYLVDGFVRGGCPLCLADGTAGLCESCGNLVAAGDLIEPRSTLYPDAHIEQRLARVLVLPMERYRARIREHHARHGSAMRPHMRQALADMLAHPLPDFPVTYPTSWGIKVPFPEVEGQVFNPNAEPAAWSLYCATAAAEGRMGVITDDDMWLSDADTQVVYFLGFDNTYPFAVAAVAMLMASEGRYLIPQNFIANEFYELDNQKFSTSRGHAIWGRDLVADVPRDLVRFHLAATSPETQRTNFGRAALERVTSVRLVEPWNATAAKVGGFVSLGELPVSARSQAAAASLTRRFSSFYELEHFSLTRVAEAITEQLHRLSHWDIRPGDEGDFCYETDAFLRCAAPILIDLAADALPDLKFPTPAGAIIPRALPHLRETV